MSAKPRQNLREQMPLVTAFIDDLRESFGTEGINDLIRRALAGEATFWASEGGVEVGHRPPPPRVAFDGHQIVLESINPMSGGKRK